MTSYRRGQSAGNLYYVRLKTSVGLLYKLGYTALPSVEARLSFNGAGHDKLLDKVLFFGAFADAAEIEERLHRYFGGHSSFSKLRPDSAGPLYGTGQSELYASDILKLDSQCTPEQVAQTKVNLAREYPGSRPEWLDPETSAERHAQGTQVGALAAVLVIVITLPLVVVARLILRLFPKGREHARRAPSTLQLMRETWGHHQQEDLG